VSTLDWSAIDTVMLDMDGTLLDLHFDNYFWQTLLPQQYAAKHQLPFTEAHQQLMARFQQNAGTLNWYCLDYWQQELDIDLMLLKRQIQHHIQILPHALEFLDRVRTAGKRMLLVTNAHPDNLSLKMERTNLRGHFDDIICSHHYGYSKEQQVFWEQFHRQSDFLKSRTLMVDDNLQVLAAARQFGIGQLLAIRKPDSRGPEKTVQGFPSVASLDEVFP